MEESSVVNATTEAVRKENETISVMLESMKKQIDELEAKIRELGDERKNEQLKQDVLIP